MGFHPVAVVGERVKNIGKRQVYTKGETRDGINASTAKLTLKIRRIPKEILQSSEPIIFGTGSFCKI